MNILLFIAGLLIGGATVYSYMLRSDPDKRLRERLKEIADQPYLPGPVLAEMAQFALDRDQQL